MNFTKFIIISIITCICSPVYAIWNGDPVNVNYQFMVSIQKQYVTSGIWTHWCGGSLINQKYILTAGHCIANEDGKAISREMVKILTIDGQEVATSNFYLKPDFYWQFVQDFGFPYAIPENDLAIIELKQPLTNINLAKLPNPENAQIYYSPNNHVVALGYGWYNMNCDIQKSDYDPNCSVSYPILRSANMYILHDSEMKWNDFSVIKASLANPYFYSYAFVGVFSNEQAPTAHDSGGPLIIGDSEDNGTIIGIFSSSINYPQFFQPSIYTRIATNENISWIKTVIQTKN